MTQSQLNRLVNKWRKKLRLGAPLWEEIKFEFKPDSEMEDHLGWCDWSRETGKAWGAVLDPQDLIARDGGSVESIVVHELLHILLQGHMYKQPKYDPDFERALNVLTSVLVPEKKNGQKTTNRK